MIIGKSNAEILKLQDTNISDCKTFRQEWERLATEVELSYKGNKFPQYNATKNIWRQKPGEKTIVNILKRQHRSILNLFLSNEPEISARRKSGMKFEDLEKSKMLLKQDFTESDFYDEEMDNITNYGLKRGIIYALVILNGETKRCETCVSDSMDTYIDITAQRKKDIRHFIKTFTKSIEEAKNKYKNARADDGEDEVLDWDKIQKDREKTESDEKKNIIKEPTDKDIILFREGWYLDYKDDKQILVKVLSIKDKIISITEYPEYDFLPITYFAPINDPDSLYVESWYAGVLEPERIVNRILNKFVHIVETGGRYVYVREGTKLTKGKNKLLESLGIEVIEIGKAQELPKEATLLSISNSQMVLLEKMIRQAEEEGGMRQDIMGGTTLGSDASGKAIQAMVAGSKGNIGMPLAELNKFMNRLAKIYFKIYQAGGAAEMEYYDSGKDVDIKVDTKKLGTPKIHIEARNAFDDIVEKGDGIQMLEYIKKFNPEAKISPQVITEIYKLKSDLAEKIEFDMRQEENPDMKMAEASIALLMQGKIPAVSETDDHEIHMALLGKLLQTAGKQLPEKIQKNIIDKYKTHEAYMGGSPADDEHRQE